VFLRSEKVIYDRSTVFQPLPVIPDMVATVAALPNTSDNAIADLNQGCERRRLRPFLAHKFYN